MGQKSRASDDVSTGGWTPTPIYPRINEPTPDLVEVSSAGGVSPDTFEVKLAPLAWPKDRGDGTHQLRVRAKKTGTDMGYVTVALFQGTMLVAAQEFQADAGYQDLTIDLTAAEVALISDYSDLRLLVIAGRVTVPCCPVPVSPLLKATFTGALSVLGTIPLLWLEMGIVAWRGLSSPPCGLQTSSAVFQCLSATGNFILGSSGGAGGFGTAQEPATDCSPFSWSATGSAAGDCAGAFGVTVTE